MFEQRERLFERQRFSSRVAGEKAWRRSVEREQLDQEHREQLEQLKQLKQKYREELEQRKQEYYDQLDQKRRQEREATKMGRECAALLAELDMFEETQAPETSQ